MNTFSNSPVLSNISDLSFLELSVTAIKPQDERWYNFLRPAAMLIIENRNSYDVSEGCLDFLKPIVRYEDSSELPMTGSRSSVIFSIGENQRVPLGIAFCHERVLPVSYPSWYFNGLPGEVLNEDMRIEKEDIKDYKGYDLYSGGGPVLQIVDMCTFFRNEGLGELLINSIKSRSYELIELCAENDGAKRFFEKHGFIDTGLTIDDDMPLMVWVNESLSD